MKFLLKLNPIQDGVGWGGKKTSPTSFYRVPSTNIGISPQNFLAFSFDHLATLM